MTVYVSCRAVCQAHDLTCPPAVVRPVWYYILKGMRGMKLKDEFIVHNAGYESLLIPTGDAGFTGLVRGNKTLGIILDLLKQDTTEEAVIAAMCEQFDAPEEIIARDVKKAVSELRRVGAIDET